MPSYPVAYRGGRGLRNGPRSLPAPDMPPIEWGPLAGAAAFAWAARSLYDQLGPGGIFDAGPALTGGYDPASLGWTLVQDCGFPPNWHPTASFTTCTKKVIGKAAAEAQVGPATAPGVYAEWDRAGSIYNAALLRYENCQPARRWSSLAGAGTIYPVRRVPAAVRPLPRPWDLLLLGGPDAAFGVRAYEVEPKLGRQVPRYGETMRREILDIWVVPGTVRPPIPIPRPVPRPVTVPRAVPMANMVEKKFPTNSRLGQAFFMLYRAFNFLGDSYGFIRALWKSLPRGARGKSRTMGAMVGDLFRNFDQLDWMAALARLSLWKLQDSVVGFQQQNMFNAIGAAYGFNAARTWSTLDSAIRQSASGVDRAVSRSRRSPDTEQIRV